jgi:hypothetical protein
VLAGGRARFSPRKEGFAGSKTAAADSKIATPHLEDN